MITPVTQRDVAAACKVHPSTICLALNNSPSIPLATRQRIRSVAQQLGYRPNAAARNLAFMRAEKGPAASLPLAWINQEPARDHWRTDPVGRAHWEGARRRAAELGYHLEEFALHESGMTAARLAQIIHARGIQGVVFPVARTFRRDLFQAAWGKFACITFNDHRGSDWMDAVCPDYFHNTGRVLAELTQRGYARIGLVLSDSFDAATRGLVSCRYLRYAEQRARAERLPVCLLADGDADRLEKFEAWQRRYRPDVVVCRDPSLPALVSADQLACVQLGAAADGDAAGMNELPGEIAAAAIERLADKIRRYEKGIGGDTQCHLLKGRWCDGPLAAIEAQAVA